MLNHLACFFVLASLAMFSSSQALADGLIYQLPADGAWVRYVQRIEGKGMGAENKEQNFDVRGRLTLSSVRRIKRDGEPHRWIEINSTVLPDGLAAR